jgi:phage terminase large subunit GpA-like protein
VLIAATGRVLSILTPPPKLTISQWADEYRVLSPEASAEPGQWRTDRAPYLRDLMDAVSDPTVERVVAMFASQSGKTEALLNIAGFHIHQDAAPILVLLPTIEMAATWSQDRLAPMLRDSPALRGRVADARARDSSNTKLHKSFRGGHITLAGANSAASLSARPIRILLCDEVDRYPASAGSEGDPLLLARNRTRTFWNRKQVEISSPTIAGVSRIEASYNASDRRKFWVPCPHCGELQVLEWERVRWTDDDASTARYYCVECGVAWSDQHRLAAVRRGAWRASAPFRGIAGFHLSELYSPWRRLDQIVQEFIDAKGKPTQLKVFKNTVLALPWQEAGEAPDWERLIERREAIPMGEVPAQAVAVTVGVDNQIDRLELATWAWAAGYESWLVDTKVFMGNPGQAAVWDALAEYLNEDLPVAGGGTIRIERVGVDTGGLYTTAIYGHLRRLRDRRIIALKGAEGWNKAAPVTGPTLVDVLENGRKLKRGLRLWTVAVSTFKTDLLPPPLAHARRRRRLSAGMGAST